jgi:hypothetical protein
MGRGAKNFTDWSIDMFKEFGNEIAPVMKDLWNVTKALHDSKVYDPKPEIHLHDITRQVSPNFLEKEGYLRSQELEDFVAEFDLDHNLARYSAEEIKKGRAFSGGAVRGDLEITYNPKTKEFRIKGDGYVQDPISPPPDKLDDIFAHTDPGFRVVREIPIALDEKWDLGNDVTLIVEGVNIIDANFGNGKGFIFKYMSEGKEVGSLWIVKADGSRSTTDAMTPEGAKGWVVVDHRLSDEVRGMGLGSKAIKALVPRFGEIQSSTNPSSAAWNMWVRMKAESIENKAGDMQFTLTKSMLEWQGPFWYDWRDGAAHTKNQADVEALILLHSAEEGDPRMYLTGDGPISEMLEAEFDKLLDGDALKQTKSKEGGFILDEVNKFELDESRLGNERIHDIITGIEAGVNCMLKKIKL